VGWVSKTDLVRYVRCPYAFWLQDTGRITFDDTVDDFQLSKIRDGREFQASVEAGAIRVDVMPRELPSALRQDVVLYNTPTFRNAQSQIHGRPDGIQTAHGALIPMEIKSHKDTRATDQLELAFYWLLLEPYRTRDPGEPRGWLCLRRDGAPYWVEVRLHEHRFDEVHRHLDLIRHARRLGVIPRICRCQVCSHVKRDDVYRSAMRRRDLTLVWGIGRHYAPALEQAGIATWEALLSCDVEAIRAALKTSAYSVSSDEIERWREHAASWGTGEARFFGTTPFTDHAFIALDL
jgi:predicted RecB family nuclease